jgi:MYXO-CTERM domain-containing protein
MRANILTQALAAAAIFAFAPAAYAKDDVKERAAELAEQANDVQQQAGALANEVANAEDADADADADAANAADNVRAADDGDGDGFDWGLLGLLGLAGLLGLKRDDRVRTDVRGDTRL